MVLMQIELRIAFWQIILTAGPLFGGSTGLLVGIIQAATSINEMTLSFVPKLIIVISPSACCQLLC